MFTLICKTVSFSGALESPLFWKCPYADSQKWQQVKDRRGSKWKLWSHPCSVLPLLTFLCCPSWHSYAALPALYMLLLLPFACCPSYCNCSFAAPPSFWLMSLDKLTVFQVDHYGNTGCGVLYRILNCIKWNHWILWIGVMGSCQKVPKFDS